MDRSDVAYLVARTYGQDEYGVSDETETKRRVFCSVRSVSHREKVENGLVGIQSSYQLSMFKYDYNMEEIVEYNGQRYVVYDATEYNDLVRLYIQKEKGI